MDEKKKVRITNEVGALVGDNENTIIAGERGPATFNDVWLFEKMAHFNREVIPERRMHAKGWGVYGHLTITKDISKYTKAAVLQKGTVTECFARLSTVAGERGAADTERDIRGCALKFYTSEGNWDLVGNNTPVFFLRDAHNFVGLNRAVKRDPRSGMRDPNNNWDFWTMLPEALHQITITMSDRGIPATLRNMDMFGSHTYSLINKENKRVWVKFHFKTMQGIKNLTDEEAGKIAGQDRDYHGRDLFTAIERKEFPRWKLCIQVMSEAEAKKMPYNPFDITKVWYHKDFPLIEVGILEFNRNPENYFAEVEQAGFSPAHVVPGIGFSPDKFLQARMFSYGDAQRYRLGVNYNHIPVNKAKVPVNDNSRDGYMRTDGNFGAKVAYTPNGYNEWMATPEVMEPALELEGVVWAFDPKDDPTDHPFEQAGLLFNLMSEDKKALLIENTARNMNGVKEKIKYRHLAHCYLATKEYGTRLCEVLGLDLAKVMKLATLTHEELLKETAL